MKAVFCFVFVSLRVGGKGTTVYSCNNGSDNRNFFPIKKIYCFDKCGCLYISDNYNTMEMHSDKVLSIFLLTINVFNEITSLPCTALQALDSELTRDALHNI